MAATRDAPSTHRFSPFYAEEAVITNVNRSTWSCTVQTMVSAKTFTDVRWSQPYLHYASGEGIHYMPEVGAHCYIADPVDSSPAFILCFVPPPGVKAAQTDRPVRATTQPSGSSSDVTFQANRADLNPGDIALTTRDNNFVILRRGGIVQIGATPLAQRIMVPVRNFVRDFCENYELVTPGGEIAWLIDRPELEEAGQPPCTWSFAMQELATDAKASVRIRHMPLPEAGGQKAAWEVVVAPQGIDRVTGAVASARYTMTILLDGTKTEIIGASRSTKINGDDTLQVGGDARTTVGGSYALEARDASVSATGQATVAGAHVKLGDANAFQPAVLGQALFEWLSTAIIVTPKGGPGTFSPASLAQFARVLSRVVTLT